MRLHSDNLTAHDIDRAAVAAGVALSGMSRHGSRKRAYAYEINLSGSGVMSGQWGNRDEKSASWDEWGVFLAHLFALDDSLTIPRTYESHAHFTWATNGFYEPFVAPAHGSRHRWQPQGLSVTRSYYVSECKCGAVLRILAKGHTFAELEALV